MREQWDRIAQEQEAVKLPPLKVAVTKNGELVRSIDLRDPREEFIEAFNERCCRRGLIASVA
jgi:hypothetical protein